MMQREGMSSRKMNTPFSLCMDKGAHVPCLRIQPTKQPNKGVGDFGKKLRP